jgi:TonB-linked SusC/RagA family outer membrane protein
MNLTSVGLLSSLKEKSRSNELRKLLLVMRLTIFLVVIALQVGARGFSQNVTLSLHNASLSEAFQEIRKQTGYNFLYNDDWLQNAKKISITLNKVPLKDALDKCFEGQPFTYTIIEKTIALKPKPTLPNDETNLRNEPLPPIDVRGRILNEAGEPVLASVVVKGSNKGTTTNADGYFELKGVSDDATLVITASNIETRELKLNGRSELSVVNVKMRVESLNEVIINKGYYTEKQRFTVGNTGKVTAKEIENQPVTNPLLALQGRVAGVFITQSSGISGGGVTVRIQGQNSMENGSDPLYVIDGVPYLSQLPSTIGDAILGLGSSGGRIKGAYYGTGNPMNYINVADIESIEILKDADATAIYGSRAANGAILVTTKKGKVGQTKLDFNIQQGWGKVPNEMKMMDRRQYLDMRYEALRNDGINLNSASPVSVRYSDLKVWDTTRYTDWQKELIGGTAKYSNINLGFSGGTQGIQYRLGSTWNRITTVFPGDFNDQKVSVNFNLNTVSSNQKFRIQFSGNYLIDDNKLPNQDLTSRAILTEPVAPSLYNMDGSLNWALNSAGNATFDNPLQYNYSIYKNKTSNLISNAVLSYNLFKGMNIKSSFGYNALQTNDFSGSPIVSINPNRLKNGEQRTAFYGNRNINSWIIEPQLNYAITFGKSKIDVLVGSTIQQNNLNSTAIGGSGYSSDRVLEDVTSATSISATSIISKYRYNAAFGRFNYNWSDKYIFDLTGRRDGSSRFGPQRQFHNFGSVGAAWIFSEEKFVKQRQSFLSFGKLKGSYGTTASDQIGDYFFFNLYGANGGGVPYQGLNGLRPNRLQNPYLAWEETKKLQVGIDLGFFRERLNFSAVYVHNRSSNQLLNYVLPRLTGFSGIYMNFPATIQNTAWEFSIHSTTFKNKNSLWTTGINLTIPRNKIVAFPGIEGSSYAYTGSGVVIGQPLGIIAAYRFLGVETTTGEHKYSDAHGDATSTPDPDKDQTALINIQPKFYGGFENSFSFKSFQLEILFQFVKQTGVNSFTNFNGVVFPGRFLSGSSNQPVSIINQQWQKPGDVVSVHKYTTTVSDELYNLITSDRYYSDASYARLKNFSLSWQIPQLWQQKIRLKNCKVYMEGQNLITITKYKGLDPENQSTSSLPPLRVYTVGLQIGL